MSQKIKTNLCIVAAVLVYALCTIINFNGGIMGHAYLINFLATIFFIVFQFIFMIIIRSNRIVLMISGYIGIFIFVFSVLGFLISADIVPNGVFSSIAMLSFFIHGFCYCGLNYIMDWELVHLSTAIIGAAFGVLSFVLLKSKSSEQTSRIIKNSFGIVLSIFVWTICSYINIYYMIHESLGNINFIVSLIFITFNILFIIAVRNNKILLIFSASCSFICFAVVIFSAFFVFHNIDVVLSVVASSCYIGLDLFDIDPFIASGITSFLLSAFALILLISLERERNAK